MFRYVIISSMILFSSCHKKHENKNVPQLQTNKYTFHSEIMGEERSYAVYSPTTFEQKTPLPVLFILDGPSYFSFFKALSDQWGNKKEIVLPEMIIVAIKQNNRSSEFLPSYIDDGKGDKFLRHIEKELIPAIESSYNVLPNRTLFGHSRGGLFALNVLLTAPELFNNFIVSDPSISLGNSTLIKRWNSTQLSFDDHNNNVFVGLADTKEGYSLDYVLDTNSDAFPHMRTIWSFCEKLEADSINNQNFKWKYYEGFGHGTIPAMVAMDGLLSVFEYYRMDKYGLIYSHLNGIINYDQFKQKIISHFKEISERMGSKVLPYESLIFEYGQIFLEEKMNDKAIEMFQWNVDNFPENTRSLEKLEELSI
ncbi:alpha/beta hydrolase [Pareuzebyella sediminis]|uniref:alpha/beta hydrolase n=1 Tax=Pareuzebyella sediminis TaxID=2607998 RepID=UPI0018E18C90|nr:alpha/beta hydrolase-fold protein [Pareuzebyella sediminis]